MKQTGLTHTRALWLGYGACALASCLWGTGFYFGRLALNEISVEYMVLYRFVIACVGLLPVVLINRVRFTRSEWKMLLACAALGIPIQFLLQFHGLALTTVSHASLMVGTMPVLLAVSAVLFAGERMDWMGWLALIGSTIGTAMIVLHGHSERARAGVAHSSLAGDLLVVLSLIIALAWVLLSKKLMRTHSPPVVTAYTVLVGTLMLALWVLTPFVLTLCKIGHAAPPPFAHLSATAWLALVISGLLCTATTTLLWNWGIHHAPASRAGVFLNLEPAIGSVLGVELLGEHLGPYAWLGGALILTAAIVLTLRTQAPLPLEILE